MPGREVLQVVIEQHHLDVVAKQELRRQRKRFGGILPQAIYSDDVSKSQN